MSFLLCQLNLSKWIKFIQTQSLHSRECPDEADRRKIHIVENTNCEEIQPVHYKLTYREMDIHLHIKWKAAKSLTTN